MEASQPLLHNLTFGPYALGIPFSCLRQFTLTEFSPSEYAAMRPVMGERIFRGETILFLAKFWKTDLGILNDKIFKIALTVEPVDPAADCAADVRKFWTERLGLARTVGPGLEVWDATDGNVVLQTATVDGTQMLSVFITSVDVAREYRDNKISAQPEAVNSGTATELPQRGLASEALIQFGICIATGLLFSFAYSIAFAGGTNNIAAERVTRVCLYTAFGVWAITRALSSIRLVRLAPLKFAAILGIVFGALGLWLAPNAVPVSVGSTSFEGTEKAHAGESLQDRAGTGAEESHGNADDDRAAGDGASESVRFITMAQEADKHGDHSAAVASYHRAIDLDPVYGSPWVALAFSHIDHKERREALSAAKHAVQVQPELEVAWFVLGDAYFENGQKHNAVFAFKEAVRLNPQGQQSQSSWLALAVLYADSGDFDDALSAWEQADRISSVNNADILFRMGIAYQLRGNRAKVLKIYDRLKSLDPRRADDFFRQVILP